VRREEPLLAFVGPMSSGKSSLIGRLLLRNNVISSYALADAKKDALALGDEDRVFALLVDEGLRERMDGHTYTMRFVGRLRLGDTNLRLIDTPGDLRYLREILSGICVSDVLALVIGKGKAKEGLIRFYLDIARLHEEECIVILNDVHANEIEEAVLKSLKSEYDDVILTVCEVSAIEGRGLRGLEEALSDIRPKRRESKELRMPVLKIAGDSGVLVGVITHGRLSVDEEVLISPTYKVGTVCSIERGGESLSNALAGDDVGILLKGIGRQYVKPGNIVGSLKGPPPRALSVRLRVMRGIENLMMGKRLMAFSHATRVGCRISEIRGDEVTVIFDEPIAIESYDDYKELGILVLMSATAISAYGVCEEVVT